ncbi:MAG: hypothetical protein AAGJ86_01705 [Pseudomonadota bacterium]
MSVATASTIMALLGGYLLIGLVVAIGLLLSGLGNMDPAAAQLRWRVRLLLLPGLVGLWPLMLAKRLTQSEPPLQ